MQSSIAVSIASLKTPAFIFGFLKHEFSKNKTDK
jgi:hypothetical protein